MIEVILDHSTEEDYFVISSVSVNIKDEQEKARVKKVVADHNLEGSLVDGDRGLALRIADVLGVNVQLIDIDTQEIDLM
ncbi:hypothetical protein [Rossellomorea vietnamensis]|uniref:hypothetical protein n=1 Tax=Rossellomorea vietnamensis TaxID=218284 RepID=UPI000552978C|nr:hypothetical protein [Rossellomorea vietnamensis]